MQSKYKYTICCLISKKVTKPSKYFTMNSDGLKLQLHLVITVNFIRNSHDHSLKNIRVIKCDSTGLIWYGNIIFSTYDDGSYDNIKCFFL